jgi:glycosyltransferase involved in cell wall biosynthesis
VKDPMLVVDALVHLPETSQIQVVHAGAAASDALGDRAKAAAADNPRYRWIGPRLHEESRLLIARSHVLVLTSRLEGGANVLSEALALGTPIVTSRAAGVEGLLGEDYPGYFPVGDAAGLAEVLVNAEHDEVFYRRLQRACDKLAPLVLPANELRTWHQLLSSFDA